MSDIEEAGTLSLTHDRLRGRVTARVSWLTGVFYASIHRMRSSSTRLAFVIDER